jgi:hypothetical protein
MPTEQEREIRYLQEQVNDFFGQVEHRIKRIEQLLDVIVDALVQFVDNNRELISIQRELIGAKTSAPVPGPFAEMFGDTLGTVAKKNPQRKPKAPKLSVVSAPSDEDGPGAA